MKKTFICNDEDVNKLLKLHRGESGCEVLVPRPENSEHKNFFNYRVTFTVSRRERFPVRARVRGFYSEVRAAVVKAWKKNF